LFALCAVMLSAGSASGEGGGTADKVKLRAQLGIIYAQNAQYDEARKEFVTLLEEPTGRAAALTNIGNLAVLEGKVDVGLENYTQAVALDKGAPTVEGLTRAHCEAVVP